MSKFSDAKKEAENLYKDLGTIAEDVVSKHSKNIDDIINKVKTNIEVLTNKQICDYMLGLSIEAFYFGQKKDYATLKQSCAEALYKEHSAKSFSVATGTAADRTNTATIESVDKLAVKLLFDAVSNLMKTKLDEAHRVVNTLNGILISRNAEAKLSRSEYLPTQSDSVFEGD